MTIPGKEDKRQLPAAAAPPLHSCYAGAAPSAPAHRRPSTPQYSPEPAAAAAVKP
jgi:hypothetical protein